MLPHDQTVSKPVFNLKPYYNVFAYASVNFEIIGSLSFMINRATGEIYLREKIPDNSKEWIRTVNISVDVVDELGIQLKGITHVTFVVLPMFPGESYVTSNILDSVANQIEKRLLRNQKIRVLRSVMLVFIVCYGHRLKKRKKFLNQSYTLMRCLKLCTKK